MRDIKFKAWDKFKAEMFDPMPIIDFKVYEINSIELMQFTGFKDKTGKDIYEGDILKTPEGHIISISFGEKVYRFGRDEVQCFGWIATKISNGQKETLDDSMTPGEVIGNIYENPDLLNSVRNDERSVATGDAQ